MTTRVPNSSSSVIPLDPLKALSATWRAEAAQDAHYPHVPEVMRHMADELDALLARQIVENIKENDRLASAGHQP